MTQRYKVTLNNDTIRIVLADTVDLRSGTFVVFVRGKAVEAAFNNDSVRSVVKDDSENPFSIVL